jgi:hypothetical protein
MIWSVSAVAELPQEEQVTRPRRKLRVPELLKARGLTVLDLIQRPEFLIPPATAYRLAREDMTTHAVGLDVLERLSRGFGVDVGDLWVWEEGE